MANKTSHTRHGATRPQAKHDAPLNFGLNWETLSALPFSWKTLIAGLSIGVILSVIFGIHESEPPPVVIPLSTEQMDVESLEGNQPVYDFYTVLPSSQPAEVVAPPKPEAKKPAVVEKKPVEKKPAKQPIDVNQPKPENQAESVKVAAKPILKTVVVPPKPTTPVVQPAQTVAPAAVQPVAPAVTDPEANAVDFVEETLAPPPAPAKIEAPKPIGAAPAAVNNTLYHVQVGAFRNPKDAERLRAQLLLEGYSPTVTEGMAAGKMWHRVKLGPYPYQEAQRQKDKLQTIGFDSLLQQVR